MDPSGVTVPQGRIADIIDEASRLTASRILALSRAYPRDPGERQARTHLLEIAAGRDGRRDELRRLKARAASAVQQAAATDHAAGPLGRLGALTDAELAVQDAVLAIFLSDRLGAEQVERLSRPWLDAR
jgi:hypothetical protein